MVSKAMLNLLKKNNPEVDQLSAKKIGYQLRTDLNSEKNVWRDVNNQFILYLAY